MTCVTGHSLITLPAGAHGSPRRRPEEVGGIRGKASPATGVARRSIHSTTEGAIGPRAPDRCNRRSEGRVSTPMTPNRRPGPDPNDRELRLSKVGRALTFAFAAAVLTAGGVFYTLVVLLDVQDLKTTATLDAKTLWEDTATEGIGL
ncbi:hypothetical protein GCM10010231_55870 [Streptomyces sindenensis]|nr:hypothetical protein GCM10010231_55870 [Streptomyces sindenensis]